MKHNVFKHHCGDDKNPHKIYEPTEEILVLIMWSSREFSVKIAHYYVPEPSLLAFNSMEEDGCSDQTMDIKTYKIDAPSRSKSSFTHVLYIL